MKKFNLNFVNLTTLISFFIIFCLINLKNFTSNSYGEKSLINDFNKKENETYNFIAHAGGGFENKTYTNSIPAVKNALNTGFRLIEIDMLITKDNYIIGSHDWNSFEQLCKNFIKKKESYLYSDFQNCNENLEFKLVDEFFVKNIIDQYGGKNDKILIVTDQIQDFHVLKKNFSNYENNLIVEANGIRNYLKAKKIFPYVALTFNDGRRYKYFVKLFNVSFIVIKSNLIKKYNIFLEEMIKKGLVVMVHTSNENSFIEKNLDKYVTSIYTDFWDFNKKKCVVKVLDSLNNSPCHTY